MSQFTIYNALLEELNGRYQRESQNLRWDLMLNTTLFCTGLGAGGLMVEGFVRNAIKRIHLSDFDIVERKNLLSQNFINSDIGKTKEDGLERRLIDCEFEKNNPGIMPLEIIKHGDFMKIHENEIETIIRNEIESDREIIFIIATDYHPTDAYMNRIALKYKVAAFWVSLYRMGMAGEIIFFTPNHELPCHWCIARDRHIYWDLNRFSKHLRGNFSGSGKSMGLPAAATFTDSILNHLVIGYIHRNVEENQHGKFFRRLIREKRNFIQCQMDPDYRLDGEDIFSQIQGPDVVTFNTIFQQEKKNPECIHCRRFEGNFIWQHADYTRENYREILIKFSKLHASELNCPDYRHPLLEKYSDLFEEWERLGSKKAQK